MTVYYYGCRCGKVGTYIRKLQRYCAENNINLELKNSKYDKDVLEEHLECIKFLKLKGDKYTPLLKWDNIIMELFAWNYF